ncbi:hypothetical protein [Coleofasciculus sp.]|uniref:hypothetical protein n=1 Tax=Coleofasciculus sp. TaxID=3100458 RepID=UPI0039F8562F
MTTLPDIEKDQLSLYSLREHEYEQISRSELLSGLDIALLTQWHPPIYPAQ